MLARYLRGFADPFRVRADAPFGATGIGRDVLNLVDTLERQAPILLGNDWDGRAARLAGGSPPISLGK